MSMRMYIGQCFLARSGSDNGGHQDPRAAYREDICPFVFLGASDTNEEMVVRVAQRQLRDWTRSAAVAA